MTVFDNALLDQLGQQGDPVGDEVIARHAAERPDDHPRDIVRSVAQHLELPPEQRSPAISHYLHEHPALPAWADPGVIRDANEFFGLWGLEIGGALFLASLPEAYAAARGARVLTLTARLVTNPLRRIDETAQLVFDVMQPGALEPPAGAGYLDARRVRLMHAAVRYLILNDPDVARTNDPDAPPGSWYVPGGVPLNQEDMLGTLMTFTTAAFESLDRECVPYSRAQAESYLHAWCIVGELLGIHPHLLPIGLDDAIALTTLIRQRQQRQNPDGELLTSALVGSLAESMHLHLFESLPASATRWLIGDKVAAMVGIDHSGWTDVLFEPLSRLMRLVGLFEVHGRLARRLTNRMTLQILRDYLRATRSGDRPPFTIPRELKSRLDATSPRWGL